MKFLMSDPLMRRWTYIFGIVIVLDQLTKWLSVSILKTVGTTQPLMPMLNYTLRHNEGVAWGWLANYDGLQRWPLVLVALGVSIYAIYWLRRLQAHEKLIGWGLSLVIGGALGNAIDRALLGYVIDFIEVYYKSAQGCFIGFAPVTDRFLQQTCNFPAFNIADSAITVGAVLLIYSELANLWRHRATGSRA